MLHVSQGTETQTTGKNAELFALNLVVRRPMLITSLKEDTMKEIVKGGVDEAGVSSF